MPETPADLPEALPVDWEAATRGALEHLRALIRLDTTNPPGNERLAVDYLAAELSRDGIPFEVVEPAPGRASLVARLRGTGARGPLLLNGHLDVVPAEAEHWRHPPFGAEEHDGCIWGRGAIDMKNMVAMSLAVVQLLHRSGVRLDRDVIFAAVADEEAGSRLGSRYLVEHHPELVRAEYVLNELGGYTFYFGDTVFYPVQVAEKGICWFELVVEGPPGHGSMPRADGAVLKIARAVHALARGRLRHEVTPVVEAFLRRLAEAAPFPERHALPLLLQPRLAGALLDLMAKKDPAQAGSLGALVHDTVTPTGLSAGRKVNVLPGTARATVDGRLLPGRSVADFVASVQAEVGPDVRVNVLESWEGTVFDSRTPLYDAIASAIERHHPGAVPVPFMIPGFTDSHAYARLGATCYGFTPVRMPPGLSLPALYHGHDERIPVEGFAWGLRVLHDLVVRFCAAGR